jgi:3-O-methylgallate 3,4-dioxygenase
MEERMADIVVGIGTSHGPLLNTPPDQWGQRAAADRRNPALAFRGKDYTYDELAALREDFSAQCEPATQQAAHRACREAIDAVGDVIRASGVDALVVVSSDHKETFDDELLPQFAFYWGETMRHEPFTQEVLDAMPPGLAIAEVANVPEVGTTRAVDADLALHLIKATSAAGFDPAASRVLPLGKYGDRGIPHGWGFVYQNVLRGSGEIPFVPLFVNTFWEPNPPSAARCLAFGRALGQAIRSYPRDIRVGVVASGGLSHFVVDEELDRAFLDALLGGDEAHLAGLEDEVLRSGTSELRNWIVTAAAVGTDLRARLVDYQPCYRSAAGTGCAMAFVAWE